MRVKKLKRSLLCFAMVFCIVFSLCGCKNDNAEEEETTAETRTLSTQAAEQTTLQSQSGEKETTIKTTQTLAKTMTSAQTTTPTAAETTAQTPAQTTEETTTTQTTTQTKAETITTTTVKTTQTAKRTTTQTTKKETTKTTAKTTEETTTETTLQTLYYPEEELDAMAENMPEIVFIMSLYYHTYRNIFGYFVTNTGEVKMFDFEPIAPGEFYDVQDVYERLDEAVCDEFPKDIWIEFSFDGDPITNGELVPVSKEELKEKYKDLICVDQNGEFRVIENGLEDEGCGSAYGVRYNQDNKEEIVLLCGEGEYIYERKDEISNELCRWLRWEAFPAYPFS